MKRYILLHVFVAALEEAIKFYDKQLILTLLILSFSPFLPFSSPFPFLFHPWNFPCCSCHLPFRPLGFLYCSSPFRSPLASGNWSGLRAHPCLGFSSFYQQTAVKGLARLQLRFCLSLSCLCRVHFRLFEGDSDDDAFLGNVA